MYLEVIASTTEAEDGMIHIVIIEIISRKKSTALDFLKFRSLSQSLSAGLL